MKILIVDDSRAMQTIVRRAIEQLGHEQLELNKAGNGIEALDIIRVWEPDLIISDWHMPEMNGMELLTTLNLEMRNISMGFVTTESSEKRLQEAVDAGAQFIVQKPFDIKTLHKAVLPFIQSYTDNKRTPKAHNNIQANAHSEHIQQPSIASDHIQLPNIDTLTQAIHTLSSHYPRIAMAEPIELKEEHSPYILGLYGDKERKSVHAIAIVNLEGACILATLLGNIDEKDTHIAMTENTISKSIINECQTVLKTLETALHNTQKGEHLILRNANVMRKKNPNVDKLLSQNANDRLDISIKTDTFHCGRLTFIVS